MRDGKALSKLVRHSHKIIRKSSNQHRFTPAFSCLLAKTLEVDLEVRIDEAESELNTFTSDQDFLETVQSFRNLQKKHDSLTNRAKQVATTHEDVIFKRFKDGVEAANKELAVETKKVRELSQISGFDEDYLESQLQLLKDISKAQQVSKKISF